ncbi:MAG: hypothetical protein KKD74_07650 [Bacteroidetes bacterium]|nr:hypothetical protein [Bacteroidota bacterium]
MHKHFLSKNKRRTWITILLLAITFDGISQQFNSDNYLTMPKGTGTFCPTSGQRNSTLLMSFALIDRFEFFAQGNLYRDYRDEQSPQYFTTTVYGKYMFWKNKANTGGGGVFLGFGQSPGYYNKTEFTELHKNIWTAVPITIPFLNNMFSWDIMPGAMVDFDYGNNKETAFGFTWSTRLAISKIIPKISIVGELYGTKGEVSSKPEYKVGLRWEPNDFIIPAITYGAGLDGTSGAGFEIGLVIYTPQYLTKDFIKNNTIQY